MKYLFIPLLALLTLPSFSQEAKVYDYFSIMVIPKNGNIITTSPDGLYQKSDLGKNKNGYLGDVFKLLETKEIEGFELFNVSGMTRTDSEMVFFLLRKPRE